MGDKPLSLLWATSIDGTSTIDDLPPLDLDVSFSDLVSTLDGAMSLHLEYHLDDWTFGFDPTYVSLEIDVGFPPIPGVTSSIDIDVEVWMVEAWSSYRFHDNWEAMGGYAIRGVDLEVNGPPSPPFPEISADEGWTDWFVGARYSRDLGARWSMQWRADVVVGGDSDSSVNSLLLFNRHIGDSQALFLGYRYYTVDYEDPNTYAWDVTQEGPLIGYQWNF